MIYRGTTLQELEDIRQSTYSAVRETPLWHSVTLSELAGCSVYLKAEVFQKTGSYKTRGMYWALRQLCSGEQRPRGVITYSSGNAGQALAYVARKLNIACRVVVSESASPIKTAAIRAYGAKIEVVGEGVDIVQHCSSIAAERELAIVLPYDGEALLLGHAGLGLEIIDQLPSAKAVFVGIGGGGMAGGIGIAFAASGHSAELHGVEPAGAPTISESLRAGHPLTLSEASSVADGLAAPTASKLGYEVIKKRFQAIHIVEDDEIVTAMKLIMSRAKLFVEPAGAAAFAGLYRAKERFQPSDDVVCVVSGGNLDFEVLRTLL